MKRTFLSISLLTAIMVMFNACEKDEPGIKNPTNGKTSAVFNPSITYGTMTDQDGNVYKTVTIGTQTWMAENLRTTKYNDGTDIPNVIDKDEWGVLTTGAYCNYDNTSNTDTIATYGRLYNWYTVNTEQLCPTGWHVPTQAEWTTLITYLGNIDVAGGKLKENGTTHWNSPNSEATNETGFTSLPGGFRNYNGTFYNIGIYGYWWSATENNETNAWYRLMLNEGSHVDSFDTDKELGISVRCIKD